MINALVNAGYVWDDKIIIYYNVSGVTGTEVTYSDAIKTAETSETSENSAPPLPADSSDSLWIGPPLPKLSEHLKVVLASGLVGIIIGRG